MSQHPVYPVPEHFKRHAAIDEERYQALYQQSVDDPDTFWAEQAETFLTWDRKWDRVCESDLHQGKVAWFQGGKLNVSVNCIDRHLPERADQVAIIWEGDDPSEDQLITYRQRSEERRVGKEYRTRWVAEEMKKTREWTRTCVCIR